MGRDKLALPLRGGGTMLKNAVSRFSAVFSRIYIASGSRNDIDVGKPLIHDIYGGLGPISGLHAALVRLGEPVFLVAGDMPYADPLSALTIISDSAGVDAVCAVSDRGPEPLFSFYSLTILPYLNDAIESCDYSLYRVLARAKTREVPVDPRVAANINTPEEYDLLY